MKKTLQNITAVSVLTLSNASVAMAVTKPNVVAPTGATDLGDIIVKVINFFLLFAGAVAILFLIIGGFRYVVSAGNPDQVEGAKKTIMYAIVGLIIIFIAFALVQVVQQQLGVKAGFQV